MVKTLRPQATGRARFRVCICVCVLGLCACMYECVSATGVRLNQ